MSCQACGHQNGPRAKFCEECGASLLAQAAAASVADRAPSEYTPKHLADKILTSRGAMEGERKRVTVLFSDVKGSMQLAEQVDPEQWHRMLDRFFQISADGVHRFEGTINQFTGDGIMALFGAPIAHEDHAQRACFAALYLTDELRRYAQELRREFGVDFSVRFGINSGEVVVGKIGDDLRMDYSAYGPTVGMAARMQQIAEPGHTYLTDGTAALVAGYFELEDLGEFKVKGASSPVRIHSLVGTGDLRTRLDVSRARGFSRFVGRVDELATLDDALERSLAGDGQVVTVVAEAGAGKSRLCAEFAERTRERGINVFEAHGVSHGQGIPLLPIVQLLRAVFEIEEHDADRAVREKIAGRLLLTDESLRDALPLAFDLLGAPDPDRPLPPVDPDVRRHQVLAFLRHLMLLAARGGTAVLVIEDLHWIDEASEAVIDFMVAATADSNLLLLLNFRPDYTPKWEGGAQCREISLAPLGPDEIGELLGELLGEDPSVAELPALIAERTGGNPFFVEETVRALAESGQLEGSAGAYRLVAAEGELVMPPSVHAILAARIDRLPERDKQVLQTAAVIGREFPLPVLGLVAQLPDGELAAALSALEQTEFIYSVSLYPETIYAFTHPLTLEVVYDTQLRERTAALHGEVGRALRELHPDRLDDQAALLAHHFERAGDRLEAARLHARAAGTAVSNPDAARQHWRTVLMLLEDEEETDDVVWLLLQACQNILVLSVVAGVAPEEAQAAYLRGRDLAEARGATETVAFMASIYGIVLGASTGEVSAWVRLEREAAELARGVGDPFMSLIIAMNLVSALGTAGLSAEALEVCDRALAACPEDDRRTAYTGNVFHLEVRAQRACILGELESPSEGVRLLGELMPGAQAAAGLTLQVNLHSWRVSMFAHLGDDRAAMDEALRAMQLAERVGAPLLRAHANECLAIAHGMREEWGPAKRASEAALEITSASRTGLWTRPVLMAHLALAQAGLGDAATARATVAGALERSRQLGMMGVRPALVLVQILLATAEPGERQEIEAALAEVERAIDESGSEAFRPLVSLERARFAELLGDKGERVRALEEARRGFAALGSERRVESVTRELATLGTA